MSTQDTPRTGAEKPHTGPFEERGRDLGKRADRVAANVEHGIESATHRLGDGFTSARERVGHKVSSGRARMTNQVQEHPMRTLLYAFGAGALIGLLLSRRNRTRL
jgi:ElaB/YqjD/DUF883 family membrane-anchored ribosome-binding protein